MSSMLIKHAEINGSVVNLLLCDGVVASLDAPVDTPADQVLDARCNAVLPGLHDHHLHFFALVAARYSVDCRGLDSQTLGQHLRAHNTEDWVRGINYHEADAGVLDRDALTMLCSTRPVRIQHSSGKLWVLNDLACDRLQVDGLHAQGVERDDSGRATGRLFRMDDWLAAQLPPQPGQTRSIVHELYSHGITGFTDTSYTNNVERVESLMALPFDVYCMGDGTLAHGHLKIMLDEDALPDLSGMVEQVQAAHGAGRPVAFHCVSFIELLYLLEVMSNAGTMVGDRIEHGGIIPPECVAAIHKLGLMVVTQPGFLADRGGRFLNQLTEHQTDLYPYQRLLNAKIPVVASSDAPYGPLNPWLIIKAAQNRLTEDGRFANQAEAVTAEIALQGYLSPPLSLSGPPKNIRKGTAANLCILDRPLQDQLTELDADPVSYTIFAGQLVYSNDRTS